MKLVLPSGSANQTINIFIQDSQASDGSGKTGLDYDDMACYYVRPVSNSVEVTVIDQTTDGSYEEDVPSGTGGGFVEIDATNMPGMYRFDVPDACLADGADSVVVMMRATNAAPVVIEIQLDAQVVLAATGLDNILTTEPTGVATTFREMVVQTWRRFFKKATLTSSILKTYDDDGDVKTTQSVENDGTTETIDDATTP